MAQSKGILVSVTRGKPLVSHVEEGEVTLSLDSVGDLLPLLLSRVDTSGVVGASVEEEDAALGRSLDISNHALEVEANGLLVVVAVLLNLETGIQEDGLVVRPRRGGDVDLLVAGVVTGEEGSTDAQSTSAGDGLGDGEAVEGGRVGAVGELGCEGGELGDSGDAGVLLVQLGVDDLLLCLADGGEDVGLACIVTVGTDTCEGACQLCVDIGRREDIWRIDAPRLIFLSNLSALKASVIPVED